MEEHLQLKNKTSFPLRMFYSALNNKHPLNVQLRALCLYARTSHPCIFSSIFLLSIHPYLSFYTSLQSPIYLYILHIYPSINLFFSINPSFYLYLFIYVFLSIYSFIYSSINLLIFLSIYLSIYRFINLFIFISIYLSILCLSVYLYIYPSFFLSFYLKIYSSVYLYIYLGLLYPLRTPVCRPWERIRLVKNYSFCLNRNQGVRRPPYHVFVSCMRKFFLSIVKNHFTFQYS